MAKQKHTATTAIREVLAAATGPMKASEIAKQVVPMVPGLKGKTPAATVAAKIYTEAKREGGFLIKQGEGFVLREQGEAAAPAADAGSGEEDRAASEISPIEGAVVLQRGKRPGADQPDPRPASSRKSGRRRGAGSKAGAGAA